MSEVLKFRLNATEELHLAYPSGKPCTGITGPQFLYSLRDRRIAFADPGLDAQIQELHPKSGSKVAVTKRPNDQWEVKLLHPEQPTPPTAPAARQAAANAPPPIDSPYIVSDNPNTDGRTKAALLNELGSLLLGNSNARPLEATIPTQVQYGIAFADFLILAADAVRMAEKNSPAGSVRFDNRDVAAIATSMFIAADKSGFLTWNGAAQGGR